MKIDVIIIKYYPNLLIFQVVDLRDLAFHRYSPVVTSCFNVSSNNLEI